MRATKQFVAAINAHDVERLVSLMTADHRFIDSLSTVIEGRDTMREGWTFYSGRVADYAIEVSHPCVASDGAEIVLTGVARGSYWSKAQKQPNSSWRTPVALRAVERDGQIAEWQVYADNEPLREQVRVASL